MVYYALCEYELLMYPVGRVKITELFFFNDTATTEIYTLSLHDALPIFELECIVDDHDR